MTAAADHHMSAGAAALSRGDLAGAEVHFTAATERDPALADAWFNLAWVQRAVRKFEPALDSYARSIKEGVTGAEEAHVNRAAILAEHLFRSQDAVAEFEQALALRPDFPPALFGLAQLHEDEGRRAEARACYVRLAEAAPGHGRALARLALLDLQDGDAEQVARSLREQLNHAHGPEDRAELLFALAAALDAGGHYRDAFDTLGEANGLSESLSVVRYDPAAFEALVDRLIATFPEPPPPAALDPGAPIFLCGPFRSGSTLAEQVLARHPQVDAGGELETVPFIAASLRPYPEAVPQLGPDLLDQLRSTYRSEAGRLPGSAPRRTDKRCDNYLHLALIQLLFPGAPIVHTSRHPLDTLLSTLFLRFGEGVSYGHRLEDAAHYAIQQDRLMRHWRLIMPERIHDLRYEQLVEAPEEALRPLLDFLGLPWDDGLLKASAPGTVRTASNWQVRQPLHTRSVGRWRHYAEQLEPARRMFADAGMDLSS